MLTAYVCVMVALFCVLAFEDYFTEFLFQPMAENWERWAPSWDDSDLCEATVRFSAIVTQILPAQTFLTRI